MNKQMTQQEPAITFFISGHKDLSQLHFNEAYVPAIDDAIAYYGHRTRFILGDSVGCDTYAQEYLEELVKKGIITADQVKVYYHTDESYYLRKIFWDNAQGNFKSEEERDEAMTNDSQFDIAFVYDYNTLNHVAKNILRRMVIAH